MCSQVPGSLCVCHCYLVSTHLSLSTRGQAHTGCYLASAFQVLGFPVCTTVPSSENPSSLPLPPFLPPFPSLFLPPSFPSLPSLSFSFSLPPSLLSH